MVVLTTAGVKLREKLVDAVVAHRSDRLDRLSASEQAQLKALLLEILASEPTAAAN